MIRKYIQITGLNDVYEFLRYATEVNGDITLIKGKYAVDAKSILGVFSIDMSDKITIEYPESAKEFDKYIQQFVVE